MRRHASVDEHARSLVEYLRRRIRREGAITFREWMGAALYDEEAGYYRRRDLARWGREGDYRTSPERSALFAATFARYFRKLYDELGRPPAFHLLEAGGGAGHFALGVLRTLARDAPEVFDATRYVFDEASQDARERASALLAPFAGKIEFRRLEETRAPHAAALVFSNELLDAFPVHRVRVSGGELRELYVDLDAHGDFIFTEREPSTPRLAEHFARLGVSLAEGQTAEVNLEAEDWLARAARQFESGFVVSVDYGDEAAHLYDPSHRPEGTLRAFVGHAFAEDVLRSPGGQDLTTTVNWTQLKAAGARAGLRTVLFERQDTFLLRVGLLEQLERETALAADDAESARLRLEARELILPGGMASHFQVLVQQKI